MKFPGLVGPDYQQQAKVADQERLVSMLVERMEQPGATSKAALWRVPGLRLRGTATGSPGRGIYSLSDRLWAVFGTTFGEINSSWNFTARGTVAADSNPATIVSNGDGGGQLLITSGGNGYSYNIATATLTQVAALNAMATMCDFLDGYGLILNSATSTMLISALLDFTSWTTGVDFAQRSDAPDKWRTLKVNGQYINLYGERTSRPWYDSGNSSFPFAPYPSALNQYGVIAPFSAAVGEGHAFRLAQSERGLRYVTHSTGFAEEIISDFPRHIAFSSYSRVDDAIGEVVNLYGHLLYLISFPSADVTWAYDLSGNYWFQWGTWIAEQNDYAASRARWHAIFNGEHVFLDSETGSYYTLDRTVNVDVDDRPIRPLRRASALSSENELIFYQYVELLMETGVGTSGQAENPQVIMRRSDDYGRTWSEELWASMGKMGEYDTRIRWDGEGSARGRVYEFAWTDPVFNGIVAGFLGLGQSVRSLQKQQDGQ